MVAELQESRGAVCEVDPETSDNNNEIQRKKIPCTSGVCSYRVMKSGCRKRSNKLMSGGFLKWKEGILDDQSGM